MLQNKHLSCLPKQVKKTPRLYVAKENKGMIHTKLSKLFLAGSKEL